jgi:alanine racemase
VSAIRPAYAEIDLDAIAQNARLLRRVAAPAALCAVVKADAYGHGAVPVARELVRVGVPLLAVALVSEGVELRDADVAGPVLLLSECPPDEVQVAVDAGLTLTVYSVPAVEAAEAASRKNGVRTAVHLKLDTGMHRAGLDPADLLEVALRIAASDALDFEGFFTHLAVADEQHDPYTEIQLDRLAKGRAVLASAGITPRVVHAANSAGTLLWPAARHDLVRCGISIYGHLPAPAIAQSARAALGEDELVPAMSIRSRVSFVRSLNAGERPSYGRRIPLPADSIVATVPIGYADGLPRALGANGGAVLIGGRRRPIAGTVTMDQIVVDCGPTGDVQAGDEVVLLGRQGDEIVTAEEWAARTDTIAYEVLCRIGPRVPRRYVGGAGDAQE